MDIEEVRKVARLARLSVSDEELAEFTGQLTRVLDYVSLLDEADTRDIQPMVHAIPVSNAFRADKAGESLPREAALSNAPATDGRYFMVPDILQKDSP